MVTGVRYLDVLPHHFTKCIIDIELQNKQQKKQAMDYGVYLRVVPTITVMSMRHRKSIWWNTVLK